jgi:hypothetical protein
MQRNRLFSRTRWRLAFSYAAAMALILAGLGISAYYTTRHIIIFSAEKELEAFAGVIHDEIESNLSKPGELSKDVMTFLPQLCMPPDSCPAENFGQVSNPAF